MGTAGEETRKRRELVFHAVPPGQADRALALLAGLPGLDVAIRDERTLCVEYEVTEYALEDLENALGAQGFHLEGSLLMRIRRVIAYHCERVQRHNLGMPEPRTKDYHQHFVEAWQHAEHGDHDETPEQWRQYK
ncbi:MAG: hypothetical protein AB1831_02775 [Pseudomonadota bacterium]